MAILWCENWAGYAATADLTDRYAIVSASNAWSAATGPFGGASLRNTAQVANTSYTVNSKPLKLSPQRIFVGFWFKASAFPTLAVSIFTIRYSDGGSDYASGIGLDTSGRLNLYLANAGQMASTANISAGPYAAVCDGQWHWIEFAYEQSSTAGTAPAGYFSLYVDGVHQDTLGGSGTWDNTNYTNTNRDIIAIGPGIRTATSGTTGAVTFEWGDIVAWDDTVGADAGDLRAANFPLGPIRIDTLRPNAAGSSTQFTPNAGLNYAAVDDVAIDFDSTYVESTTVGHVDLYGHTDLPVTPQTIHAVVVETFGRNAGTGTVNSRAKVKSGASSANGDSFVLPVAAAPRLTGFGRDPATAAAWTKAGVDAAEFGFEYVS